MQDLVPILQAYFRGERIEALAFILPAGLLALLGAALLLRADRSGFAVAFAVPCVVLGLMLSVVGANVARRTPAQVTALEAQIQSSPVAFVQQESARMATVNRAWPVYLTCWIAFVVFGMGLRFGLQADWAQGLGIALVLFGGLGMVIDGFAERRARPYTAALQALSTSNPAAPPEK